MYAALSLALALCLACIQPSDMEDEIYLRPNEFLIEFTNRPLAMCCGKPMCVPSASLLLAENAVWIGLSGDPMDPPPDSAWGATQLIDAFREPLRQPEQVWRIPHLPSDEVDWDSLQSRLAGLNAALSEFDDYYRSPLACWRKLELAAEGQIPYELILDAAQAAAATGIESLSLVEPDMLSIRFLE